MGDIIDILHQQYAYNRLSEDAVSKNIQIRIVISISNDW